jgi:threonine dehydratase
MSRNISLDTIRSAATTVYEAAIRSPLIRLDPLGTPGSDTPEVYLKLELLQPIGSFKIRGAYHAIRELPPADLHRGVWTISAGNAAQGVALAARMRGASCSVLVIETAPATKLRAIERLGATIVKAPYEECWKAVEEHASDRMTGVLVHPFDDDRFISGNGTLALEIVEDLPDVDAVVAPLGGGGLLAGIGTALKALRPKARLYAAEPETAAPLSVSLAAGRPLPFTGWQASFVDGAGGRSVLPRMWPLLSTLVDASIVTPLADVANAMRLAAEQTHVICEGAAGCAVAAALSGRAGSGKIVAVASGGNIDFPVFSSLVTPRTAAAIVRSWQIDTP